ncbi:MAG: metal ABC transporter ATP-binding protein [Magnetococcales bacterium]|nr:metal ABC transporter ATP-binding protein [Magnetococcales bacterium]
MITLREVTVSYQRHPAVHHLSGHFPQGEMTAITGPNGAGKSSLFKALLGALPLSGGRVTWQGESRKKTAWLPQTATLDRSFPMRVAEVVMLGAWRHTGGFAGATRPLAQQARRTLDTVKLTGFEQRGIDTLSAGQFQRVLFARLMMQEAEVILLDEPFTAIDARTTQDLLSLLHLWKREGRTVIAILHDLDQIRSHFPQTLLLAREGIAWGKSAAVLSDTNLRRARAMAERWDESAPRCELPRASPLDPTRDP